MSKNSNLCLTHRFFSCHQHIQKGGFTGPTRPHNGYQLTRVKVGADPLDYLLARHRSGPSKTGASKTGHRTSRLEAGKSEMKTCLMKFRLFRKFISLCTFAQVLNPNNIEFMSALRYWGRVVGGINSNVYKTSSTPLHCIKYMCGVIISMTSSIYPNYEKRKTW